MSDLNALYDEALKSTLPSMGFPVRPEQYRYGKYVTGRIMGAVSRPDKTHADVAMIEGATGTGKTLGYLIPTCLHAALSRAAGKAVKVGVGTHTLALQDQLFGRASIREGRQPDFQAGDRSDLAIAIECVRRLTGITLHAAFRKGRQAYISPKRALATVEEHRYGQADADEDNAQRLNALEAWALRVRDEAVAAREFAKGKTSVGSIMDGRLHGEHYQGLIAAWLDAGNKLPKGVTPSDICLRAEVTDENVWYQGHSGSVRDADIVVFSHTMMLIDLLSGKDSDGVLPTFDIIVHDECDTLEDAASGWTRQKFRPASLLNAMKMARLSYKEMLERDEQFATAWRRLIDALEDAVQDLERLRTEETTTDPVTGRNREIFLAWGSSLAHATLERYKAIRDAMVAVRVKLDAADRHGAKQREFRERLDEALSMLGRILDRLGRFSSNQVSQENKYQSAAISWSPTRHLASLETLDVFPGTIFGLEWRAKSDTTLVVLTSATMRVPATSHDDEWSFIRTMVGISRHGPFSKGQVEKPDRFGRIDRFVCVAGVPSPFVKNAGNDLEEKGETEPSFADADVDADEMSLAADIEKLETRDTERPYDAAWLRAAASAIQLLLQRTRPGWAALVHAASFRDVQALAELLGDTPGIWFHASSAMPKDAGVEALQNGEATVLVSPSFHAGVNIRARDGGQLLHFIVTLRLPWAPPDTVMQGALARASNAPNPLKAAESRMFRISENRAIHRLTQQIGRGIRDATDVIEWWVLDPRFPIHPAVRAQLPVKDGDRLHERWHQAVPERFRGQLRNPDEVQVLVPDAEGNLQHQAAEPVPTF